MHSLTTRIGTFRAQFHGESVTAVLWRAASGTLLTGVLAAGLAVLLQIAMTRTLGESEFGRYTYVLGWVNLLSLVALLGFDTAALRFVAQYKVHADWTTLRGFLIGSAVLVGVVGIGTGVVLWFWNGVLFPGREHLGDVMRGAALLLPVLNIVRLLGSHLQGMRRVVTSSFTQSVLRPLLIGAALIVVRGFGGIVDARLAMLLNLGATVAVLVIISALWSRIMPRDVFRSAAAFSMKHWMVTAGPLMLIAGSQALLMTTDTLMLGMMRGTRESGLYSVAAQLVTVITLGISATNGIVAPMISELNARGDREGLQRLLRLSARGVMAYAIPVVLILALFGRSLLGIYGDAFQASWGPMMILAVGQLGIVMFGSVGFLLTMSGHEQIASVTIVGSALLNVALNLLLIPRWGAAGAATATAIATIARSLVLTIWARQRLGLTATAFATLPSNQG